MNTEEIQDLAIQYATEGLDAEQKVIYDAWVIGANEEEKQVFADMVDGCAMVSMLGRSEEDVSSEVKSKVLNEITEDSVAEGVKLIRNDDQEWINLPVKGAKLLELSARKQDGFAMSMIHVEPGTEFPAHDHHGVEMAYI